MSDTTAVILLAGGSGTRLGGDQPKQFVRIAGKTILEHSLDALRQHLPQAMIVVTTPFEEVAKVSGMFEDDPLVKVIAGGTSRQASTLKGLKALAPLAPRNVLIHDAARPFVDGRIITEVMEALQEHDAVDVAIPTADTIIMERDGFIESIPKRTHLLRGQTPQAFRFKDLWSCYQTLGEHKLEQFTDDCGIFLACNPDARIRIVRGSEENIKVTYPIDLILADEMFRLRSQFNTIDKPGFNIKGKRVLIFGGSRGIGKAMYDILTTGGANVISRSRQDGCDVSNNIQVRDALKEASIILGDIDAVINASGILLEGEISEQKYEDITRQVEVNFIGALNIARESYKWLKKTQGNLLFFSSSSYTRGRANYATYSATKAAIVNLTQALSEEWSQEGISVNCIIPSRTDTSMRTANFRCENQDSLHNPYQVAISATKIISNPINGSLTRTQNI